MFQLTQTATRADYQSIGRLLAGDSHNDGDIDIKLVGLAWGQFSHSLLLNDGAAAFTPGGALLSSLGAVSAFSLVEGDFTGDGVLDAIIGRSDGSYQVFTGGSGSSLNNATPSTTLPGATGLLQVGLGDFTGDANVDLFVADEGTNTYTILQGDGAGAFSDVGQSWTATHAVGQFVVLPSLDADARPDIAVLSDGGAVRLLLSSTAYTPGGNPPSSSPGDNTDIIARDLNGDGRTDLVVANATDDSLHVHLAVASGWHTATIATAADPQQIAAGDFDGDGDLDLATANASGSVSVALNKGDGYFFTSVTTLPGFTDARSVLAADFNGDGYDDLAVGHGDDVSILISTGFAITATTVTQAEGQAGGTTYTFAVTRYGTLTAPAQVEWGVTGVSANPTHDDDFTGPDTGVATFAAGQDTATITVTIQGDTVVEMDEAFRVSLANGTTGHLLAVPGATVTVQNDDGLAPPPPPPPPPPPRPVPTAGGSGSDLAILDDNPTSYAAGDGDDFAMADGGADTVHGNRGGDTLYGGSGDDIVRGGQGGDAVYGDDGRDRLFGDKADDFIHGGRGEDTLEGGEGSDALAGGQGDDSFSGGDGPDVLSGDRGHDTLAGGAGPDLFRFTAGGGADLVVDFDLRQDRLQVAGAYTLGQQGSDVVVTLAGDDTITLQNVRLAALDDGWITAA